MELEVNMVVVENLVQVLRNNLNKIFLIFLKYLPIITLGGCLINNTIYYFYDNNPIAYITDFSFGNSIIYLLFIFIASFVFKFCIWHRLLIMDNFINLSIAKYDSIFKIKVEDLELLCLYYIAFGITLILIVYFHVRKTKRNKNGNKTEIVKDDDKQDSIRYRCWQY